MNTATLPSRPLAAAGCLAQAAYEAVRDGRPDAPALTSAASRAYWESLTPPAQERLDAEYARQRRSAP